jgi:ABC-type polysaccharide/polyol phosphate export permease
VVNRLSAIWATRYFLLSLVWMDMKARYRRTLLGLGWSLLHPLAMTLSLCLVFTSIFRTTAQSYIPYLLAGLACWGYVSGSALLGCQCFFQGERYLRQHPVPLSIFPLRVALGGVLQLVITLAIVLAVALWGGAPANALALVSLAPAVLLAIMLAWALAALCGVATVLFQDMEHITQVVIQILFYLTPIIYPPETIRDHSLSWLMAYNPFVPFLDLMREPILHGQRAPDEVFLKASCTVAGVMLAAALVLRHMRRKLIFHL